MKLQALISWQSPKNQLQQENEKKRDKFWQKRAQKKKKKTLNRKGDGQSTSSPCSSHFILELGPKTQEKQNCLKKKKLKQGKLHKTQTLKKEAPQNTNPKTLP